ncbi:hypothetical protein CMI37_12485 [Candidatus Pacearchaeota archaeon]|nr:hypothetical protein [Candidatus Pacearchaeota archaeon]
MDEGCEAMIQMSDKTARALLADRLLDIGVEDALVMDGYDDCVIGVLERFGMEPIVLYDKEKVINKLVEDGCDGYEGANEFYEFNQLGAWVGDKTPGFLIRLPDAV